MNFTGLFVSVLNHHRQNVTKINVVDVIILVAKVDCVVITSTIFAILLVAKIAVQSFGGVMMVMSSLLISHLLFLQYRDGR